MRTFSSFAGCQSKILGCCAAHVAHATPRAEITRASLRLFMASPSRPTFRFGAARTFLLLHWKLSPCSPQASREALCYPAHLSIRAVGKGEHFSPLKLLLLSSRGLDDSESVRRTLLLGRRMSFCSAACEDQAG